MTLFSSAVPVRVADESPIAIVFSPAGTCSVALGGDKLLSTMGRLLVFWVGDMPFPIIDKPESACRL